MKTITGSDRKQLEALLVQAANSAVALRRAKADVEREYKPGSTGLMHVLALLKEAVEFNNSVTYYLQEAADQLEQQSGVGNMSLYEMELRRARALATLESWNERIERKKARMASEKGQDKVTQFNFVERRKSS
jgi:hypothetical protein